MTENHPRRQLAPDFPGLDVESLIIRKARSRIVGIVAPNQPESSALSEARRRSVRFEKPPHARYLENARVPDAAKPRNQLPRDQSAAAQLCAQTRQIEHSFN